MKKLFYVLAGMLGSLCVCSSLLAQDQPYAPLSQNEEAAFENQMASEIQRSEQYVNTIANKVTDQTRMPMTIDKMELQNAMIVLEVKKTLVGNFKNTLSIRSPLVRTYLLNLLKKKSISTADLSELQALVRQERPKVEAYDASHQGTPPVTPSTITPVTPSTVPAPAGS